MPKSKSDPRGVIVAKLFLEITRVASTEWLGSVNHAADAGMLMLALAAYIGHLEGRTMTAAKLAAYAGMPRPTAIRKLEELSRRGVLKRVEGGRWECMTVPGYTREKKIVRQTVALILKAAVTLSKMDGDAIARAEMRLLKALVVISSYALDSLVVIA